MRPQHSNRSIGHQFLNDGLGARVQRSFETQATKGLFPLFSIPSSLCLRKNQRKPVLLIVSDLEARGTFTVKTLHGRPAARVSKQGTSWRAKEVGQLHSFVCLVFIEIIQARPTALLGVSKV